MMAAPNAMSMFQNEMRRRLGFGPSAPQAGSSPAAGPIGMMGRPTNPMGGMNTGIVPPGRMTSGMTPASMGRPTNPMGGANTGVVPPNAPTGPYGGATTNMMPDTPMGLPSVFSPAPMLGGFSHLQHPGMGQPTTFPMFQSQAPEQTRRINLLQPWMA